MQEAVNEIHEVFVNKRAISLDQSRIMRLIPAPTTDKHLPMFKIGKDGKLRRIRTAICAV
jgi:hypothetical protein